MSAAGRQAAITLAAAIAAAVAIVLPFRRGVTLLPAPGSQLAAAAIEGAVTVLLFGSFALVALLAIRREGRPGRLIGARPAAAAGIGAAIGIGGLLLAYGYAVTAGLAVTGTGIAAPALLLIGTIAVPGQAAAEELFFRGWLQRSLAPAWGAAAAIAVAAAVFAGLPRLGGTRAPLSLLNLFLGGALFGLLADRSGGLAAPIAAHAGWNWAEQLLLGLDPNPGTGSFGAVVDRDLAGSALWGGSAEGLMASLAATFVLVALLIPIAAWGGGRAGAGAAARRRPA